MGTLLLRCPNCQQLSMSSRQMQTICPNCGAHSPRPVERSLEDIKTQAMITKGDLHVYEAMIWGGVGLVIWPMLPVGIWKLVRGIFEMRKGDRIRKELGLAPYSPGHPAPYAGAVTGQ